MALVSDAISELGFVADLADGALATSAASSRVLTALLLTLALFRQLPNRLLVRRIVILKTPARMRFC